MRMFSFILALVLSSPAHGEGLPPRPEVPDAIEGECVKTYGLQKDLLLPIAFISVETSMPKCSAIAVPLSDYADLLQTERWAKLIQQQYFLDVTQLERERDHYAKMYEEASRPEPWHQRPAAQRALGGVTVLLVVFSTGAIYTTAYKMHLAGS